MPEDEGAPEQKIDEKVRKTVQLRFSRSWLIFCILLVLVLGGAGVAYQMGAYTAVYNRFNQATVSAKVKEDNKYDLVGATLKVGGKTYTTDDHGKVDFSSMLAGTYDVVVSKAGYQDIKASMTLKRGENDLQIFSLTKLPANLHAIKGFVQDYVSDKPITNVQVTLGQIIVPTDPIGTYDFEKQIPGDFTLTFSKDGYVSKTLKVTLGNVDLVSAKVPLVPNGQLVFVSNRDGKRELYTSAYDGSGQRVFVQPVNGGEDFTPLLAPDQKHIIFFSTRDKIKDAYGNDLVKLYIVGMDGQSPVKISDDVAVDFQPMWSKNGQWLYFTGYTDEKLAQATYKVYDVSKNRVLDLGEVVSSPVFSPDSTLLAYYVLGTQPDPNNAAATVNVNVLKTYNLASAERKELVKRAQYLSDLRFGTDSKSLSYEVVIDSVRRRFAITFAAGAAEAEVSLDSVSKRSYVLSPDSTLMAFTEERDGKKDLFVVDAKEKNEQRLTTLGVVDDLVAPTWDQSNDYLIFATKSVAQSAYYIVAVAGGDPKKIVDYYSGQK